NSPMASATGLEKSGVLAVAMIFSFNSVRVGLGGKTSTGAAGFTASTTGTSTSSAASTGATGAGTSTVTGSGALAAGAAIAGLATGFGALRFTTGFLTGLARPALAAASA